MKQNDFRNDNIKFYGIKNFDELNTYICESGLDVETACRNINMSEEDINVVKLIYAREYYTLGNKEKGELFLKSYEKSKNKTNKTKSIYKYIQQNKKFYKARFEGEPRQLSLTLVPKKQEANNASFQFSEYKSFTVTKLYPFDFKYLSEYINSSLL